MFVYAITQALRVLVFEGVARQKRTIEDIAEALVMYARDYSTIYELRVGHAPPEAHQSWTNASMEIRRLAARVSSSVRTLHPYSLLDRTRLVHGKGNLTSVAAMLIGLSNSIPPTDQKMGEEARKLRVDFETQLGIRTPRE